VPGIPSRASSTPAEPTAAAAEITRAADVDSSRGIRLSRRLDLALAYVGVAFFVVACAFSFYGQLHRKQSGDTYGTVYTAVAIVDSGTIWLDEYLPLIQERSGEEPYMLGPAAGGQVVNRTPLASSLLAVPLAAAFRLTGVEPEDWDTWMEMGFLTASLTAAASVAVLFVLLTRLTTRRRATLLAAVFAWGTMVWTINGQALWQHAGATLALCVALLALIDRRWALAGAAVGAMIAFRFSTPVLAVFLLPLLGRHPRSWLRFTLGAAPFLIGLAIYNDVVFGSPLEQGYGSAHVKSAIALPLVGGVVAASLLLIAWLLLPRRAFLPAVLGVFVVVVAAAVVVRGGQVKEMMEGLAGLLVSPGRGLVLYSPVLAFAVLGAIRGWREPFYRWCALAAAAYVVVTANSSQWHGGEGFGPRRLAEAVPLLVVLLVPALDPVLRSRWRWVFYATLAWSVFVQLLAAAAWSSDDWFDGHDTTDPAIWWRLTDNELTAMLFHEPDLAGKLAAMTGIVLAGLGLGLLATYLWRTLRPAPEERL
jgi:hypothetical protein